MSEEKKVVTPEPLIQADDLCKFFQLSRKATLKAVNHVTFNVNKGETVGLVGESGCGKSTTGRCLVNLYTPTSGHVYYKGRDIQTFSKEERMKFHSDVQMIFQNPYASLNPRMTVGEIVTEGMKLHHSKLSSAECQQKAEALLARVGLNKEHMNRFSHEFSGGQRQRIGIARALSVDPEFIVCDEPISALDVSIQAQVINMLKKLQQELGLTYLFIAHDLSVVKYISDRVIVMYLGTIVEEAPADELYAHPVHPYTQALLSAIPVADPRVTKAKKRIVIKGEIPSPINPKECCQFTDRCPYATDRCREEVPVRKEIEAGHFVSCHLH
ncbi:ATP-binding cassette domain-containing protein [Cuneatibacter sp. NSJ-177]|jgi:oligopeptide transport system ATP-binding protein|uniref:ABC transporter ATP-binding protein n=1 Tax=Cuneatibacter sp. NSJ-177 TaxID=2931401 RepID=UPI001FD15B67|nr:oligopeptide/dipeptide ABC transporter ATP-binding protein [Cuneatibacter sp. NSJ-177]MCJ7837200.1 ATP-binding cassette domain-containing protein [Cuneatibacter sp. NSJ-177]